MQASASIRYRNNGNSVKKSLSLEVSIKDFLWGLIRQVSCSSSSTRDAKHPISQWWQ